MTQHAAPYTVALVTLGCDKNTVDMEYVAGLLVRDGCAVTPLEPGDFGDDTLFDAVVVLTCGFIADAKEQSVESIVAWAERKKQTGAPRFLYVAGCLAQRYGAELFGEIPEVDGLLGVGQMAQLAALIATKAGLVHEVMDPLACHPERSEGSVLQKDAGIHTRSFTAQSAAQDEKREPLPSTISRKYRSEAHNSQANSGRLLDTPTIPDMALTAALPRLALDAKPYAFLKIADGCDHACAFCAIPAMKGGYRSVSREILLDEARALLARGAREINLIAQDITPYGRDLYGDYRLPELLQDLCALPGDFWVRCLYAYPGGVDARLMEAMASLPKVAPYLDMPLQHLDPGVLRAMRRPAGETAIDGVVARLRAAVPGIALRTTFLVGHPGESVAAFNRLRRGAEELAFAWMGVFAYSEEEGTPAAVMPGQVGRRTRERRRIRLLETQARITEGFNAVRVGRETTVLVESVDTFEDVALARSPMEAPEVDGVIRIAGAAGLHIGDLARVRITGAEVYDLEAETV